MTHLSSDERYAEAARKCLVDAAEGARTAGERVVAVSPPVRQLPGPNRGQR